LAPPGGNLRITGIYNAGAAGSSTTAERGENEPGDGSQPAPSRTSFPYPSTINALKEAQPLRAVHIIAGLDPAHGGPSYSVPRLCEALAAAGAETALFSLVSGCGEGRDRAPNGVEERRFPWDFARVPILRDFHWSCAFSRALGERAAAADVIHDHGLWLMPNVQAGWAARRAAKPLVVSPRGMLAASALAFSRSKKRAFWSLFQGPAFRHAASFHATSEQEYEEIRAFGLAQPVAVIGNGIDLPELVAMNGPSRDRVVLSLGRIHPKKGLDRLLRAWARVESLYPEWRLRIIGPSEGGHEEELQGLARALGLRRASIEGPVYGEGKLAAHRAAELFVLPTANENFGLALAEALANAMPAISTKGAPWSGLEREGCGWWIDPEIEAMATALTRAMALPRESLKAMGAKGRAWMARDFSWDRVARDVLDLYRWLSGETDAPETVRFL
jgi:glycosyltransferase involved in cell wall biosynthesis